MSKLFMKSGIVFIALLLLASFAHAGTTGKIAGRVLDKKTNEGLPGANVIVAAAIRNGQEVPVSGSLGAATDLNGNYVILNIPPGIYKVRVAFIGYNVLVQSNVTVSIDLTTKLDFALQEEAIQGEEVVVVAERPLVQKDLTSAQASVTTETIQKLPVQNLSDVVRLQAGVSVDNGGGIHIRGGRTTEVAYFVDGVSVTDSYNGASSVRVENESVQELQVISGTFNAEYGNAMSGIINIVTKEGSEDFHGNVTVYGGDHVSSRDDLYLGINELDPLSENNAQFSLSGPVPGFGNRLTFFATGRRFESDGWLNGRRMFDVNGDTLGTFDGKEAVDGEIVPMNTQKLNSAQVKLTYRFSPKIYLSASLLGNDEESQGYDGFFRWNPDARRTSYDRGYNANLKWTHTLSARAFYTLNFSNFYKEFRSYLFEDPADSRYLHPDSLQEGNFSLNNSGTSSGNYQRNTVTNLAKFDFTWQANLVHQLKFGFEGKRHRLFEENINTVPARDANGAEIRPYRPVVLPDSTQNHGRYAFNPMEFSAYLQDKIEYENVVINAGLRFDFFNSNGLVLNDPTDPNVYDPLNDKYQVLSLQDRLAVWYKDPTNKYQVSPRFGISYPITDKGIIHFSYGHFLQIPNFDYLFQNPGFKVPRSTGRFGIYGNADLDPQKTVMYELGLQQQVGDIISLHVTGFYRDIRDWVGTGPEIVTVGSGGQELRARTYFTYVNLDYANVRGLTISMSKARASMINYSFDYTFQVAEGSNSDPGEEFGSLQAGREPTQFIVPLNWDQRHNLNATLSFNKNNWNGSLIGNYNSGLPYTPTPVVATRVGQNTNLNFSRNSRVRPYYLNFDLRLSKSFRFAGLDYGLSLNVYNLFDRLNEQDIYTDSGRATTSSIFRQVRNTTIANNTAEEFLRQPNRFSEPREVQLGVKVSF